MIRVRGITIEIDEVLSCLKQTLQLKQTCNHILHQRIINQVSIAVNLSVTHAEIQAEIDRIRYENRLFQATDLFAWLTDQLITAEEWETGIRDRLLTQKLSQHLFATAAEQFFLENRVEFDQVLLYRIVVPYEQIAREICYAIEEGELSFFEAAHIYHLDSQKRYCCGYEGKLYRCSFRPELSAIVFSATPGQVIGPLSFDQTCHLLMVEEFTPAELTPDCYQKILDRLFQEWITTEVSYLLNP